jgi:hypothetical protein
MRIWLAGPRLFGGLIRPGVSFRPDELLRKRQQEPGKEPIEGSFVYVVTGDHGRVKIGVSTNPSARMAQLRTASAFPLEFAFIGVTPASGYEIEQAAHAILSSHRQSGEWFAVPADMAVAAVQTASFRLNQNLLRVTPEQAEEILRIAASAPPARAKRGLPPLVYISAGALVLMAFGEYRMMGDESLVPLLIGNGVAAAILLPVLAKFG